MKIKIVPKSQETSLLPATKESPDPRSPAPMAPRLPQPELARSRSPQSNPKSDQSRIKVVTKPIVPTKRGIEDEYGEEKEAALAKLRRQLLNDKDRRQGLNGTTQQRGALITTSARAHGQQSGRTSPVRESKSLHATSSVPKGDVPQAVQNGQSTEQSKSLKIQVKEKLKDPNGIWDINEITRQLLPYRLPLWTEQGVFPQIQIIRIGQVHNHYLNTVDRQFCAYSRDVCEAGPAQLRLFLDTCRLYGLKIAIIVEEHHQAQQTVSLRLFEDNDVIEEYNNIALKRALLLVSSYWAEAHRLNYSSLDSHAILQQMLAQPTASFFEPPATPAQASYLPNITLDATNPTPSRYEVAGVRHGHEHARQTSPVQVPEVAPSRAIPISSPNIFHPCAITPAQSPRPSQPSSPVFNKEEEMEKRRQAQQSVDFFLTQMMRDSEH